MTKTNSYSVLKLVMLVLFVFSGIAPNLFNYTFDLCVFCEVEWLFSYDFTFTSTKGNSRLYLFLYRFGFMFRLLLVFIYLNLDHKRVFIYQDSKPVFALESYILSLGAAFALKDCIDCVLFYNIGSTIYYEIALILALIIPITIYYARSRAIT